MRHNLARLQVYEELTYEQGKIVKTSYGVIDSEGKDYVRGGSLEELAEAIRFRFYKEMFSGYPLTLANYKRATITQHTRDGNNHNNVEIVIRKSLADNQLEIIAETMSQAIRQSHVEVHNR